MGVYTVAVKDRAGEWSRHSVSIDVYVYIRQLESAINNPSLSGIKNLYPERFKK